MVKKMSKKVAKKGVQSATKPLKVDYYPNKMTVAVSAAAAVSLTLIAVLATSFSL